MINWKHYPINVKIPYSLKEIVEVFEFHEAEISSAVEDSKESSLVSNAVLAKIVPSLIELQYNVEMGKKAKDKVRVPVTYKERGEVDLAFEADAYNADYKIVLEVEAGRAVMNFQFLKDLFQACMMPDVEYLCIAVKNIYRYKDKGKTKCQYDYQKVIKFMDALHISRMQLPLKGILIIGY